MAGQASGLVLVLVLVLVLAPAARAAGGEGDSLAIGSAADAGARDDGGADPLVARVPSQALAAIPRATTAHILVCIGDASLRAPRLPG